MNSVTIAFKAPVVAVAKAPAPSETGPQTNTQSTDSTKNSGGASDFAGTLHQVSGKPGKKSDPAKGHAASTGGGSLPVDGSASPPPAAAAALATPTTSAPVVPDPDPPGSGADSAAIASIGEI